MSLEDEMIQRIRQALPEAKVHLSDLTGTRDHWEAVIIASGFEGMGRLQRQRTVFGALGDLMRGPIHALTFKTLTPAEADKEN